MLKTKCKKNEKEKPDAEIPQENTKSIYDINDA